MPDPVNYYKADAAKLAAAIVALDPEIKIEKWRDFGFAVDAIKGARQVTACQPDTEYQRGIFRTPEEVIRLLQEH